MCLSLSSFSFSLTLCSAGTAKSINWLVLVFFIIPWSGTLAEIRWYVCMSKSQRIWFISFSRTDFRLCIPFVHMVNLDFWHNSQWITFPTQLFFTPGLADGFFTGICEKKVTSNLRDMCIPADLNNAVVWMVSALRLISNTSSPITKPL